ncbi:MAG: hypothetical protein V7749_14100 [Cocleimonas sp.]
MNRFTPVATVFSVLLLSGCGGSDGNDITSAGLNTFNGSWSNGCEDFFGEGLFPSITINGSIGTVTVDTYENSDCSGLAATSDSQDFNISYVGGIALSDCFNGQKVDVSVIFPVTIDGVTYTEAEYNALTQEEQDALDGFQLTSSYDLLCTNQAGTTLYSGDETTGDGSSDATRPTSADLANGINKVL